ncbi:MAG: sigma-70 family RNA polymerase sigma factor [Proteobacteria bacterium]|nr:sigma-70 family RNA polymerase sigma factor [Pseudomonadota bacterium]
MVQVTAESAGAPEIDEAALLARLREGDDKAYETLVRAYTGRLLAVARRFLRSEEDAQDAVQDAFLSAFRAIDRFQGGSRVSTWLHRIVVNACLMRLRTRRRKPEQSIEELLPRFLEDGHVEVPTAPWKAGADHLLESRENRDQVREAIGQLPENYRTVVLLRDIEEFDTDQTAEALGISRAAVKTRLHRARQALRTLLASHFE